MVFNKFDTGVSLILSAPRKEVSGRHAKSHGSIGQLPVLHSQGARPSQNPSCEPLKFDIEILDVLFQMFDLL